MWIHHEWIYKVTVGLHQVELLNFTKLFFPLFLQFSEVQSRALEDTREDGFRWSITEMLLNQFQHFPNDNTNGFHSKTLP